MDNNCPHHEEMIKRMDKLEDKVSVLEKKDAGNDEKFKQICTKIDKIIGILEAKSQRLPNLAYSIAGVFIGSILGSAAVWFFTK